MKPKFKPSWEIYNRIIWDTQINEKVFSVGYVDRVAQGGTREKPLVVWDDSDIPWGRVQYFACQGMVVWHREQKIDLLTTNALPEIAFKPAHMANRSANFFPKPMFHHVKGEWRAYHAYIRSATVDQLKIATFNILSNPHHEDTVRLNERVPFIIDALQRCDADILVLQEVRSSFLKPLLSQAWIKSWFSSERASNPSSAGHKTVILSKKPFTLIEYLFSPTKKFPIATFSFNETSFHVIGVHLSSNYAANAAELRQQQLTDCINFVETLGGSYAIAGDFNMRGDEGEDFFEERGLNDLWKGLHPDELGYTFEPERNPWAAEATLTGLPARFDRILLREGSTWQPLAAELFANQPIAELNLFLSDHYGLHTMLKWQTQPAFKAELHSSQPTYKSAVVLIPPKAVWPSIQALREQFDSKIERWMPHITLLYGFLPDVYFAQAAELITNALQSIKPFSVTLTEYGAFSHRASHTAWLKPDVAATHDIQALQETLFRLFPQCSEQNEKGKNGFTPHLTIGQFKSLPEMEKNLPIWQPITFPVESIALISRTDHQPFAIRYQIALKTGVLTYIDESRTSSYALRKLLHQLIPPPDAERQALQSFVVDIVQEVCDEVLGNPAPLQPYGSALLGTNSAQSDVDLLCITPLAPDEFLKAVYEQIEPICDVAKMVVDAKIPILRMTIEGVAIDLQAAYHASYPISITSLSETERYQFDAGSWLAVSGYLEGQKIPRLLKPHLSRSLLQQVVRFVKAWAKTRLIYGQNWGFLGGYSWTILAAWACLRYAPAHPSAELTDLVAYFFQELARYDWLEPISLVADANDYQRHPYKDKMPILTTIKPCYNSATTVTTSTLYTMQAEFKRAANIVKSIQQEQANWETLFLPANIDEEMPQQLHLRVTAPTSTAIQQACSWITVKIIQWLITLERELHAFVRPSTQFIYTEAGTTTIIGLRLPKKEGIEADLAAQVQMIRQEFQNWQERPSGCELGIVS